MELKEHGITAETPKNLLFNAGVLYKNLKWVSEDWQGTPLGATNGGVKFMLEPEYLDAELDGATVKIKGCKNKVGEVATLSGQFTEISENLISEALHLKKSTQQDAKGYVRYQTKSLLEETDYLENVAMVGTLNDGRKCIVVLHNAFCESAIELDTKKKSQATYELVYSAHATLEQTALNHLPVDIYFPDNTSPVV